MKRVLTIAGSDSGGGAGIQADLKTFAARGVFGMSVLTALTAQNTVGVQGVFEIPPEFVARQIDSVADDIGLDAVKTGMLSSAPIIAAVAEKIRYHHLLPLVVDPVMVAKSGDALLRADARDALIQQLLPLATVVTPNLHEARALCGFPITNLDEMRRAAETIYRLGPQNVVVKGGHLPDTSHAIDILYDGESFQEFRAPRIETRNDHGTGCTFGSAIAAELAKGNSVADAVRIAKDYLTQVMRASAALQIGHGHGPMNHMALLIKD
ncbi:MAG: bifunctional hydroxymethylpyrimidine kinase/phosphomethylpyrimidine kinase [Chloroflexota bacterium]|nr:bifunctional hydroxymethylpyrimidine kinase/phosphomethylpyrimidine kinase [Chloroflexota bacterium]